MRFLYFLYGTFCPASLGRRINLYLCTRMKILYLFNPENDMALACASPYYMAPASARRMAAELSVLPAWYAAAGDAVWIDDERRASVLHRQSVVHPAVQWVTDPAGRYDRVCPWGWNPSLVRRLHEAGVSGEGCPLPEQMVRIRQLSGRHTAAEVLAAVRKEMPVDTVGEAFVLTSLREVEAFVQAHAEVLLKAPWSGSGRGILRLAGELTASQVGWVTHVLTTQGTVMGEPYYSKVLDFAMEFKAEQGRMSFAGYSLFETDVRGRYKTNWLATDEAIEARLVHAAPDMPWERLRTVLAAALSAAIGSDYQGYLGVDMMVCASPTDGRGSVVHPCVEINLRMNMGVVARLFYDRYVHRGRCGRYVVEYYARPGEAAQEHARLMQQHPLQWVEGKIRSGYLSLTPVEADTAYQVYVVVD